VEKTRRMAAARVRSLTKEDFEARGTLAMLGAISPLVGMLDSEDLHSQIDSLYVLKVRKTQEGGLNCVCFFRFLLLTSLIRSR